MPEISVIVPVYRVEPYLRRCVDSILSQTFTDFELILVDDGSPDNCGAICDEYTLKDSRVRVIHKQNGGLSDARNAGIDIAQGNYLTFVDSDDWIHKDYLSYLYLAATESSCAISICKYTRTSSDSMLAEQNFSYSVVDGLSLYKDNHAIGVVACAKLYRRAIFGKYRYPVGKIHEDEFLTYKLLYAAGNVAYVDLSLYFYFQNSDSITQSKYSIKKLDRVEGLEEQWQFFQEKDRMDLCNFARGLLISSRCNNILKLQEIPEGKQYIPKIRRKLQKELLLWGHALAMSPLRNKWEYAIAFPLLHRAYSIFQICKPCRPSKQ